MRQMTAEHTYEELRGVVADILLGREKTQYPPSNTEIWL